MNHLVPIIYMMADTTRKYGDTELKTLPLAGWVFLSWKQVGCIISNFYFKSKYTYCVHLDKETNKANVIYGENKREEHKPNLKREGEIGCSEKVIIICGACDTRRDPL